MLVTNYSKYGMQSTHMIRASDGQPLTNTRSMHA